MGKWELVRLGNVFPLIKNGASIKQGDSVGSGYPITRIETIADGTINRNRMGYAGIEDLSIYSNHILNSGDILMSHINSVKHLGKTALYQKLGDEKIIHGMNLLRLHPNKELINSRYASYFFNSYYFKQQLPRITKNSVNQSSFTVTALKELQLPLPPLDIQWKIADVLDRAAALIEKRKAQIEKLDLLIKSRFIEMFGDPVVNPYNWEKVKLSRLGSLNRGKSKHRPRNDPELLGGEYPFIQTGDVANAGIYIIKYTSTYSELGLAQSKMWSKGALCITIAANIAKTGILTFDACFPDSVVGFLPNDKTNTLFINFWFCFFQRILEEQAPESAQKNINLNILNELEVICPPVELQHSFASFVENIDQARMQIQRSLAKLETIYSSLMQKCFRGEIF